MAQSFNPVTIMLINMTIVFGVLAAIGILINVIRICDPTAKKNEPEPEPVAVSAPAAVATAAEQTSAAADDQQLVAVITAALAAYGCGGGRVVSIKPLPNPGWTQVARISGLRK